MIIKKFNYTLQCDNCNKRKDITSMFDDNSDYWLTCDIQDKHKWTVVNERDDDWSKFEWHKGLFCDNKKCQAAAQKLVNKARHRKEKK